MASMLPVQNETQGTFTMKHKNCYVNWDKFCVGSLESAKEEVNKKRVFRYKSINNIQTEEARLRHVTVGIAAISAFIEAHGWKTFVTVAVAFALAVGGTIATGGGVAASGGMGAFVMSNPVTASLAGMAIVGGGSYVAYYGYKLYKHKELVVKVKDILIIIKPDFDQYQPGYNKHNKPRIQSLYNQSVRMVIEKVYECEIMVNDLSLPIDPICLCGEVLEPTSNTDCYGNNEYSYVICDVCDKRIYDEKDVYHCPKKKIPIHPDGYDICIKCARKHNDKFKRYHAVIIQSLPENGQHIACKDAKALESVFKSLNYHEIVTIKEEKAQKKHIKKTLQEMSVNNKNDVVIICYSGHGEKYGGHWSCRLENDDIITDQELVECVKYNNDKNRSFGATCDVVILLNACYSGHFKVKDQNKKPKQMDDEKMPQCLLDYDELGRNMVTIAACKSNENANFYGEVSPFYKLVIEELSNNKNATPQTIHQYIEQQSNNDIMDLGIKLAEIQNVQRAFKKGKYALNVPLCPAVRKY